MPRDDEAGFSLRPAITLARSAAPGLCVFFALTAVKSINGPRGGPRSHIAVPTPTHAALPQRCSNRESPLCGEVPLAVRPVNFLRARSHSSRNQLSSPQQSGNSVFHKSKPRLTAAAPLCCHAPIQTFVCLRRQSARLSCALPGPSLRCRGGRASAARTLVRLLRQLS